MYPIPTGTQSAAFARSLAMVLTLAAGACSSTSSPDCDNASLSGTCTNGNGQCVEFDGVNSHDRASAEAGCEGRRGTWGTARCPSTGRLGSCAIDPLGANTDVTCSPAATIVIRYYAPFTASSAEVDCADADGGVWTPG